MILTLKIKLNPNEEQKLLLLETIKSVNKICNDISEVAWENKVFNQFKIHKLVYHDIKNSSNLSAQVIVRAIAKINDAYKLDRKVKRVFKPFGAITYDSRILTYKKDIASIWCIGGRQKIAFNCFNKDYLPCIKGEADLIYRKGKFFLFQCVDIPDVEIKDITEFTGVDFGINQIVATNDGVVHTDNSLMEYREKRQKVRSSIQSKDTRSSKKLLKRLSGRERTHSNIVNHTIAKSIVLTAKKQDKGIAIEDLTNIRFTSKRRSKKFKTKLGKWSFHDLRQKLTYKALLNGVKLIVVNPRHTSQTCHSCNHIGKRTNKTFKCVNTNCSTETIDADYNASIVIAGLGVAINTPERNSMFCSLHNVLSSKTQPIAFGVGG
jgi:IS605 OrfB family transposase